MRLTGRLFLLTLLGCLLLAGCSRATLVYRNLDLLVPWSLDDYLDLDRNQRQKLRARLGEHLAWHCRTQLPDLLAGLERLRQQSAGGELDRDHLRLHYLEAKQAIHAIAVEITPTATELLRDLDDAQLHQLARALDSNRLEHREKYLAPPLERQIRERAERMQERLEHWFGPLDAAQRQRVLAWSHGLGAQNARWLRNREHWQRSLLDALNARDEPGFAARIAQLLQERETLLSEADRTAQRSAEQAALTLLADLHGMADERQREHLQQRLARMHQDLATLDCRP
ncbi:putative lipoprotein [Pseudomonas sp. BAY1663]|uniref:DUF6279 family lipoprotein n=1 Tax=Pseudomonas sp. BAY1663 TaxID=1439940 RepID=UPI00042DE799|nr:DUF6279 family lipoprotein [Pseudomonas sp. BAY1663]EXF46970.1 putative lipoprotein [Pseudomonas sp. BAY1663]